MPTELLACALAAARHQLESLTTGDIDDYLEGADAHANACQALLDAPAEDTSSGYLAALQQLVELNRLTDLQASERIEEIRARLAFLKQSRDLGSAYLSRSGGPALLTYTA